MFLHPHSSPRPDGALARGVVRVAGVAAGRPKAAIALWLVLVAVCIVAGGMTGTRSMTDNEAGAGESAKAEQRIEAAGLQDPAVESILIRSGDARQTAVAAADLERRLRDGRDVRSIQGPAEAPELARSGGRVVLVQARLRGDPGDAGDPAAGVTSTSAPPPVVETAAYFVAAEAITNAAKHAGGVAARVRAAQEGDTLVVEVSDSGRGGADPGGGGLIGLRHRVEALDGRLTVTSSAGRGTTVRAELPCGS